jgi:hypothetical protein
VTANRWAELRQVGFATLDHAAAVRTATELLALGPGFADPLLAELDAFLPRDGWFWDDLPAAQAAQSARTTKADDILAVDVAVTGPRDPAALTRTWAAIIGIEPPVATADGAALAFGRRTIRFVPAQGGRTGIVAVDVHATDREHGTGQRGVLCHTMINFV